jgi:hypothetical protein
MIDTNVTELRPSPQKGEGPASASGGKRRPKDAIGALRARRFRRSRKRASVTPAVTPTDRPLRSLEIEAFKRPMISKAA